VVQDMKAGDFFTRENLRCIRPGFGLPPKNLDLLIGKRVGCDVTTGTPMSWELLIGK
jgi:sialic acid synthase SpsE